MSYILEALRKAERERSLGQVPTLDTGVKADAESPRRGWPWLVAGALVLNAIVLGSWLLYSRTPEPELVSEVVNVEPPPPAPPPEPAVVDYLPPPTTVVEEPINEPPVVTVTEPARPQPPVRPTTPEIVEAPEAYTAAPVVEEPLAEETPVAEEVPMLRDMPTEYRRSLPEMKIDAHFHTDVPGRSFVMINLNKYRQGERLAEGPVVDEIVPEGVILSYQGQRFLLTP